MAYLPESELEKEQKKQAGVVTPEKIVSAESGTISSAAAPVSSPSSGQPKQSSGSFTNLQNYVKANQGNDAGIGNRVQQVVSGSANKADQARTGYVNTATQAVNSATVKDNNVIEAVKNNPANVNKADFQKQYNATYQGPQDYTTIGGYQDAISTTKGVEDRVKAASGTSTGAQSLVKEGFSNPRYTAGEQRLDSFLLTAGDQGKQALSDIRSTYSDYGQRLTDASQNVSNLIDTGRQTTEQTRADTRAAFDSTRGGLETTFNDLTTQVTEQNKANAAAFQNTMKGLASANASARAKAYQAIGLTYEAGEYLRKQGYNPGQMVTAARAQSLGDVVDPTQVSNYQALLNLIDQQPTGYNFAKAGGENKAFNVNQGQVKAAKDVAALDAAVRADLAAAQQKRDDALSFLNAQFVGFGGPDDATLNRLGISESDYQFGYDNEITPLNYISAGGRLKTGDVIGTQRAEQYANLLKTLGIKGPDITTEGNAGAAYNFDRDAYYAALKARREEIERQNAPRTSSSSGGGGDSGGGGWFPISIGSSDSPYVISDERKKKNVRAIESDEFEEFLNALVKKRKQG